MNLKFSGNVAADKSLARAQAKLQRGRLSAAQRAEKSARACDVFSKKVSRSPKEKIALYWPLGDELDCKTLIEALQSLDVAIGLPRIIGADMPLQFCAFEKDDKLLPAQFGTFEPRPEAAELVPNIIALPLLAFDRRGARLGYGGGFYDRTIASMKTKPTLIGLAFDAQEFDRVPVTNHDVALDMIVSETGLRTFDEERLSF